MSSHHALHEFSDRLLAWFDLYGRKNLPWQNPRSPYRVWVSEIMLQQTQVKTVIPYFERFMAVFPDVSTLALATEDEVLSKWAGLGYYSRGLNLLKTAKIIHNEYQSNFPQSLDKLQALPGIGPSTAAAIASQAFGQPTAILDGNVKRVLCRYFMVDGWPERTAVKKKLWDYATQCMPKKRCADYTQAIMDLGAICCTNKNPDCMTCPLNAHCKAHAEAKVMDYPEKRARKDLPLKKQQFLVLYNMDGDVYLEKRPPVGIWSGLWCLPATDALDCPKNYIQENYSTAGEVQVKELTQLKHSFSHFQLQINAVVAQVSLTKNQIAEPQGKWFNLSEIDQVGLPKPVRTIIDEFIRKYSLG